MLFLAHVNGLLKIEKKETPNVNCKGNMTQKCYMSEHYVLIALPSGHQVKCIPQVLSLLKRDVSILF